MIMHLPSDKPTSFVLFWLIEILGHLDRGAALFWAKKYKEACSAFSEALAINKNMLVSDMKMGDYDSRRTSNESQCVVVITTPSSSFIPSPLSSTSPSCSCQELLNFVIARSTCSEVLKNEINEDICSWHVDKHCKIYAHPALLVVRPCEQLFELIGRIPAQDIHLTFSLIILFNMALSEHMHALDQTKEGACSNSTRRYHLLFTRAYLLYNHAKVLLVQLQLQSCWFLSLVVLNNEAQLLFMMGEHHEASSLFQFILSYLCYLNLQNRRAQEQGNEDIVPIAALEAFVHNTSYMILKEVISAAAA